MSETPEDIFKAMNASRILIAILTKINSISIPEDLFISSNIKDRELSVTYNDETKSFEFSLREESQGDYELIND